MPIIVCANCSALTTCVSSRIRERNYCSRECYTETRKKDSIQSNVSCEICDKVYYKTPSDREKTERNYCSMECFSIGRKTVYLGSGNPFWKGGATGENQRVRQTIDYKDWRLQVFERDNFTCCKCLGVGGRLEAHHIRSFSRFPELRLELSNGVTLCKTCHNEFHSEYGKLRFTSDDLYEWRNN